MGVARQILVGKGAELTIYNLCVNPKMYSITVANFFTTGYFYTGYVNFEVRV